MGQDRANPAAMILSATMMLRHLGSVLRYVLRLTLMSPIFSLDHTANNIASATFQVLNAGRVKTADMGGKSLLSSRLPRVTYSYVSSWVQVHQPPPSLPLR